MLYDAPVHTGYKILTHSSDRRFAKNGFNQVGNTTLPTNPINPQSVKTSSIYNKNLSVTRSGVRGISEAGYGRRFPYYGLSYAGAGSPRSSLRYSGAGSPRSSLRYSGAGSPRTSLRGMRDAYINDNPAPGTLGKIGIPGRRTGVRGLADDTLSPLDDFDTPLPADTSGGFFSTIGNVFSSLFGTAAAATTQAGSTAVANAINGGLVPTQTVPSTTGVLPITATPAGTTKILGMAIPTTALLLGGGLLAYMQLKSRVN